MAEGKPRPPHRHQEATREVSTAERRAKVAALYRRGQSLWQISQDLGASRATIWRDVQALLKQWRESQIADTTLLVAAELEKISALEHEHWEGWFRTIGMHEKRTRGSNDKGEFETVVAEELAGDPRFLDGVMKCIERRCKLLGLDAPSKLAGADGQPLEFVVVVPGLELRTPAAQEGAGDVGPG